MAVDLSLRAIYINLEQTIARSGESFTKKKRRTREKNNNNSKKVYFKLATCELAYFNVNVLFCFSFYFVRFEFSAVYTEFVLNLTVWLSRNEKEEEEEAEVWPIVRALRRRARFGICRGERKRSSQGWKASERVKEKEKGNEKETICSP